MNKNGFVFGAAVLMAANIAAKALGAVFKIPLAYILGEYGMAVFNTAFSVYMMVLSLVNAGFPIAISRGVSVRSGMNKSSAGFVKTSRLILLTAGSIGSAALFFGAVFFAYAMREVSAVSSIRVLAPSVLFVAWGAVYKCYYQGRANMIPTAISQVVEALVRLIAGIGLALYLSPYGAAASAAGALAGVTVGEFIASAILRAMYRPEPLSVISRRADLREITAIAVPLIFASLASNLLSLADITTLRLRLAQIPFSAQDAAQLCDKFRHAFDFNGAYLTQKSVSWLYGAYSGYASVMFHLPCGIIATLGVSLFPLTARAAQNNLPRLRFLTDYGTELAAAASVPCAVILFFFAKPILAVIFRNSVSAPLLSALAFSLFPACAANMLVNILYSAGCVHRPFFYSLFASIVKLVILWFLAADVRFNILAAPISLFAYSVIVFALNIIGIKRQFGFVISLRRIVVRPLFCGAVMSYTCILIINSPIRGMFLPVYLAVSVFIALGVYTAVFYLTGGRIRKR